MQNKKKICKCGCNVEGYIWSKGMLKQCFLRLNPSKSIKKSNKPIAKISAKGLIKKELKTERTKEIHLAMFNWWKKQPINKCMSCGCNLPSTFHTYMVDHLIEKSSHPELALEENNFYLTCLDDHSSKTNGFPTENHRVAINKAKEKYVIN